MLRIDGQPRDLGGFRVRRLLPHPERQMVGPSILFDHLGPAEFAPGEGIDVRPHPHIGLATVTSPFEGVLRHRDSLGFVQDIHPEAVNWMTAGRGIQHSERTPPEVRAAGHRIHAIQTWVARPRAHEETGPAFVHHPAATLPVIAAPGARLTLIAGTALGATSPVAVLHPTFYLHVEAEAGAAIDLPDEPAELGLYVASGAVRLGGARLPAGTMAIPGPGPCRFEVEEAGHVMLFGGAPMDGPRIVWWNLVASDRGRIEAAKAAWREAPVGGRFGAVPGGTEWIPLPEER
ncbi:pirin family protein [Thermaurantiacus sp.]